jgi:hypothetical protein
MRPAVLEFYGGMGELFTGRTPRPQGRALRETDLEPIPSAKTAPSAKTPPSAKTTVETAANAARRRIG